MGQGCAWLFDADGDGGDACMRSQTVDDLLRHVFHQSNGFSSVQHHVVHRDLDVGVIQGLLERFNALMASERGPHREDERLGRLVFFIVPTVSGVDFVGFQTDTPLQRTTSVLFVPLVDPNEVVAELGFHGR